MYTATVCQNDKLQSAPAGFTVMHSEQVLPGFATADGQKEEIASGGGSHLNSQ